MIVDIGTHLDFFDILHLLGLACRIGLFLGLIFEFADVQKFRDWWEKR